MPAIASLSINDGLATPVAHTFAPVSTTGSAAKWADRSPSIPSGYRIISDELSEPNGNRTTYKRTIGLFNPTVQTVNGVDTVTRYEAGQLTFNFHPDSTLQERTDSLAYLVNFLQNATVKAAIVNVEPFY